MVTPTGTYLFFRLFDLHGGFFIFHPVFLLSLLGFYYMIHIDNNEEGWVTTGIFLSLIITLGFLQLGMEGFSHRVLLCIIPSLSIGLSSFLEGRKGRATMIAVIVLGTYSFLLFLLHISVLYYFTIHPIGSGELYRLFTDGFKIEILIRRLFERSNLPRILRLISG